jgi:hypothetical protein
MAGALYRRQMISDRMRNYSGDQLFDAVVNSGLNLQFMPEGCKSDKCLVLAAVHENGNAIQFASDELKDDREIIMAALENDGSALYFCPDWVRDDESLVLVAIKQSGESLQFASEKLRTNLNFMLQAVKLDAVALHHSSEEIKRDVRVFRTAILESDRNIPAEVYGRDDCLLNSLLALRVTYCTPFHSFAILLIAIRAAALNGSKNTAATSTSSLDNSSNNKSNLIGKMLRKLGSYNLRGFLAELIHYAGVQVGWRWRRITMPWLIKQ